MEQTQLLALDYVMSVNPGGDLPMNHKGIDYTVCNDGNARRLEMAVPDRERGQDRQDRDQYQPAGNPPRSAAN